MELIEAIKSRKSIRGYKPTPVPKSILEEIIQVATRAPSGMNIQPWEFFVLSGDVLDRVKKTINAKIDAGEPASPEVTRSNSGGVYLDRQRALGIQLFKLMNITREDQEKRTEWGRRGLRYFDAPAVIIITMDKTLSLASLFDIGAVAQTIALVALEHGLGTCIQMQGVMYPKVLREIAGIPDSKIIPICISIGYPDSEFPANQVQSEREPVSAVTKWCGF